MSTGTLWALCNSSASSPSSPNLEPLQRSLRPRRTFQNFSRERAHPLPFILQSAPGFHSDSSAVTSNHRDPDRDCLSYSDSILVVSSTQNHKRPKRVVSVVRSFSHAEKS